MTQHRLYSVAETLQVFNMGSYKSATADLYLNLRMVTRNSKDYDFELSVTLTFGYMFLQYKRSL